LQVLLLAMFLSCILKKPDVDDDDLTEDDNNLKQDEEFLSRSERDIQGRELQNSAQYFISSDWRIRVRRQLDVMYDLRKFSKFYCAISCILRWILATKKL